MTRPEPAADTWATPAPRARLLATKAMMFRVRALPLRPPLQRC
jgi:hypothetical protein